MSLLEPGPNSVTPPTRRQFLSFGIRTRMLLMMMGLLIGVVVTLSGIGLSIQEDSLEEETERRIQSMRNHLIESGHVFAQMIQADAENDVAAYNFSHLRHTLLAINEWQGYAILTNREGVVFIDTRHPENEQRKLDDEASQFALAQTEITHRDYEDYLEYILPIQFGQSAWGVIRLGYSLAPLKQAILQSKNEIESARSQMILWDVAIVALFISMGSIIVYIVASNFTRPIVRLTESVTELARGHYDRVQELLGQYKTDRNHLRSPDEIDRLTFSFMHMGREIQKSHRALEEYSQTLEEKVEIKSNELLEAYQKQRELEERVFQESLKQARNIQMSMMSTHFPRIASGSSIDLFAQIEPAREVGGDFYDFFFLDPKTLLVTIADVCDKGMPAALFMVMVKTTIRAFAYEYRSPSAILKAVNPEVCRDNHAMMFATIFLAIMDLETGVVTYANGGHNDPVFMGRDGTTRLINGKSSLALGILEETEYEDETLILDHQEGILFYTDGVTESMSAEQELYGERRLLELLEGDFDPDASSLSNKVLTAVRKHAEGAEQSDDITILALRRV